MLGNRCQFIDHKIICVSVRNAVSFYFGCFQSLTGCRTSYLALKATLGLAGTIPVVVGPPNIDEFAPGPNTLIYIKDTSEVKAAAARIKYLASNETAYNETIRQVFICPSSFELQFEPFVQTCACVYPGLGFYHVQFDHTLQAFGEETVTKWL